VRVEILAEDQRTEAAMNALLSCLHEAGNPYFDWLLGGAEVALPIIASRLRSPQSELYVGAAEVLRDTSDDLIGCLVAHTGAALTRCRTADAVAYLHGVGRAGRAALTRRMRQSRDLFACVEPDEFYLSKVGVRPDMRRRGHGRALVERFLAAGLHRGLRRFALDVSESNVRAVRLYESMGFHVAARSPLPAAGITYLDMRLEI
jgi:ribosomal protein S18 acetylase RimI-like enzyme